MGANPVVSNGSMMSAAGVKKRLKNIIERGGKVVIIDPRETESTKVSSEHHFIRPNSDLYFLLAFLHICFRDKSYILGDLEEHIVGFELLEPLSKHITPKKAAQHTLINEEIIERLAKEYFQNDKAVIYGRLGVSTQTNGGLNHWLITVLNILSNNFDKEGGMMFPSPAIEIARGKKQSEVFGRYKSRVSGLREFHSELPVSAMAEEFSTSGEGQLKAFISVCGNPVLSSPNGKLLDKSLEEVEFMLSIDNYINETSRHADIILPTPSGLEIDNYDLIFSALSVRNSAKFYESLVDIESDRMYDWQILKELSSRLNENGLSFIEKHMTPRRILNIGLLFGKYGKFSAFKRIFSGLSLNKLIKSPSGVDLGTLIPRIPEALITEDKKIHIAAKIFTDHLETIISQIPEIKKEDEFYLIGRRNLYTVNTWMHQVEKLSSNKNVRCTALIHPSSAQKFKLLDGEEVLVSSKVGKIKIAIEITDTIMQGVLSIPHGFGHTREGVQISHAIIKAGVSVNDITEHTRVDTLTGNAAFSSQIVRIEKIKQEDQNEQ
jgi:anaerobic selenocysteine-containing dehydrogenase